MLEMSEFSIAVRPLTSGLQGISITPPTGSRAAPIRAAKAWRSGTDPLRTERRIRRLPLDPKGPFHVNPKGRNYPSTSVRAPRSPLPPCVSSPSSSPFLSPRRLSRGPKAFVIGLAAPLSGPYAIIGEQMRMGAAAALASSGAELVLVRRCRAAAQSGEAAAARFIEREVAVVVGFVCTESVEAALPALAEAAIPVISPVIRTVSLTDRRERTGWPFFRLTPRGDAEHAAVAEDPHRALARGALRADRRRHHLMAANWSMSFRLEAEMAGLSSVFRRYLPAADGKPGSRSSAAWRAPAATHVLVGGDREDIAHHGEGCRRDRLRSGHSPGGEALRAAPGEVADFRGCADDRATRMERARGADHAAGPARRRDRARRLRPAVPCGDRDRGDRDGCRRGYRPACRRDPCMPAPSRPWSAQFSFDEKGDLARFRLPASTAMTAKNSCPSSNSSMTARPGPKNLITDVAGLRVGQAEDHKLRLRRHGRPLRRAGHCRL